MCVGIGSCVTIVIHDPVKRIGGLAHPLLPRFQDGKDKGSGGKYVDTAIYLMVDELEELGGRKGRMRASLVGGAQMFFHGEVNPADIGRRNVEAARVTLRAEGIPIAFEDVGGNRGKTVAFDTRTGALRVTTSRGPDFETDLS